MRGERTRTHSSRPLDKRPVLWRAIFLWFILMPWDWGIAGAYANDPKQILIIHSNQSVLPATVVVDTTIRKEMQSGTSARLDVFSEYLDKERFPEPEQEERMAAFLRDKYARRHVDLLIATGAPALSFLLQHRPSLFVDAPILFVGVSQDELNLLDLPPDVVGVVNRLDPVPTVELALRLQPDARHVVVVAGTTREGRTWEAAARRKLLTYEGRLDVRFLHGLPMAGLLREVGRLPSDGFVLFFSILTDGAGQSFIPRDVAEKLGAAASVPVYGVFDTFLGHGIVGGSMNSFEAMGRQAGQLGLGLLSGHRPEAIPSGHLATSAIYVDWRQLQRWGLSESRLPIGSIVRFREPSLWRHHKWEVMGAVALLVTQSVLVAALAMQSRRRRRAEEEARESEEGMSLAAVSANLGFWRWDIAADRVWAGETCRRLVGLDPQLEVTLGGFLGSVHREDVAMMRRSLEQAGTTGKPYKTDWRMVFPDGTHHWVRVIGRSKPDASGQASSIMGVIIDITQEKEAEAELLHWRLKSIHLTRVTLLGELSGAIAHELNQPLTAILGNAQAALLFLARDDCEMSEIRTILADIAEDGKRAGEVIRHLRTLFTKSEWQANPLNFNEVVADVLKLAHSDLVARDVRVTTRLAPDLPMVNGDRVQLQQVLLNLIVNACDAMVESEPGKRGLTVVTVPEGTGTARFWVADCGSGIAADMLDQLFKPFVTSKSRGLGLGLSLCRSIIAAHGGSLWAVNNPDLGATFHVTLPTTGAALS